MLKALMILPLFAIVLAGCSNANQEEESLSNQELAIRVFAEAATAHHNSYVETEGIQIPDLEPTPDSVSVELSSDFTSTIIFTNHDIGDGFFANGTVHFSITHINSGDQNYSEISTSSDITLSGKRDIKYTSDITLTNTALPTTTTITGTMVIEDIDASGRTTTTTLEIYEIL